MSGKVVVQIEEDQYSKPVSPMEGTTYSLHIDKRSRDSNTSDEDNSIHESLQNRQTKKQKQPIRHETWTILTDAKYVNFPIYSLPQISVHSDNTSDTQLRELYFEYQPPPDYILKIYDFIWEVQRSTIISATHCRMPTSANPFISGAINNSKKYAFIECCGFSAAIIAAYLFILTTLCKQKKRSKIMKCFNKGYFDHEIQTGFWLKYKDETISINEQNIHEKLYMVFMLLSGYAGFYHMGWNARCPMHRELDQGINLVSLTGYPLVSLTGDPSVSCATFHHFIVYVFEEYCIIFDSWAGGEHGCRDPWIRIMKLDDMQRLINYINDLNNPLPPDSPLITKIPEIRTEIFKNFFNAPDKLGTLNVREPIYVGILNNSTDLNNRIWNYLSSKPNSTSVLAGPMTQAIVDQFDVCLDKPSPPTTSPPPSLSPHRMVMGIVEGKGTSKGTSKGTRKGTRKGTGYTTKPKKTNKQNNKHNNKNKKKTSTQKNK